MKYLILSATALSACLACAGLQAETINKPHTFSPNTPAKAEEVNENFNKLYEHANKLGSAMDVDSQKRVGIGTATPGEKLTVQGVIHSTTGGIKFPDGSVQETAAACANDFWSPYPNSVGCFGNISNVPKILLMADKVGVGTLYPKGKLDVNGTIYQRGNQLHADYVFEPDYKLESIDDHAAFMWREKHLPAVPKAKKDAEGKDILEVGAHRKGMLEELEKAHVYIEQLHQRLQRQEQQLSALTAMLCQSQPDAPVCAE